MTSMASPTSPVVIGGGVDTHGQTHHAAVIDGIGRQLGDREFAASPAGSRALTAWLGEHGTLEAVSVEGTSTYGVELAPHLRVIGIKVMEVDRPDRKSRRARGKSDPLDAYAAARAVLSGSAAVVPKLRDGRVEAIRALRVARSSGQIIFATVGVMAVVVLVLRLSLPESTVWLKARQESRSGIRTEPAEHMGWATSFRAMGSPTDGCR